MNSSPTRRSIAIALVAFIAGFVIAQGTPQALASAAANAADSMYRQLSRFSKVLAHIENSYVEAVSPSKLIDGAIQGMLATLDPHSAFLTAAELQDLRGQKAAENLATPGIELTLVSKELFGVQFSQLIVVAPLDDSPAARAGIEAGDQIIHIDGRSTVRLDPLLAEALLTGPEGSKIVLGILRKGFKTARNITLLRALPRSLLVDASMVGASGQVGYLRIKRFDEGAAKAVAASLKALHAQANGSLAGLILDLRNNPGGRIDEAARIADLFLPGGRVIFTLRGREGVILDAPQSHAQGTEPGYPMAVLINGGTASSAELIAGALRDEGRARLVGSRSFGKGSVQMAFELEDGSALKLTVAHYQTPSGQQIHGRGIEPDVAIGSARSEGISSAAALDFHSGVGHIPSPSEPLVPRQTPPNRREDPVLAAALELFEKP
jgi:carboxyl-terminal processing protease